MSEPIRRGPKPINPGARTSFMFSPSREIASQIEEYVQVCQQPANAVITQFVAYALDHAHLQDKTVKEIRFID
jgi:hypothetical protein